jgi:uncharacterized protein (DUF58 family)
MDPRLRASAPRAAGERGPDAGAPALAEIARAARVLAVRSRRDATGLLVGQWRSAFRGGGVEFEESRPYVPGDDVRSIDWNATARTGVPWVKRFREERSCPVLLVLDVSASMAFGTTGRSKAQTGAWAAALLATAAARAGDPVGLVLFADRVEEALRPGRGDAHVWHLVRAAAAAAERPAAATDFGVVADWIRAHARRRALVVLLSDFRAGDGAERRLAVVARQHDLVAVVIEDPRERALPAVGGIRLRGAEPGGGGRLALATRRRQRDAYAAEARARSFALARRLRDAGADPLWLGTDADPLRELARFFRGRGVARRARR